MNNRTAERLSSLLEELITEAVAATRISSDNVDGLDDTIADAIETALGEFSPEACNIRGLSSEVEDAINGMTLEVDAKNVDGLDDAIAEGVHEALRDALMDTFTSSPEALAPLLVKVFETPEVQAMLETAVKKALLGLVQQFLSVPTAQPVSPVTPPATPPTPSTVRFNGEGAITEEFRRELERGA